MKNSKAKGTDPLVSKKTKVNSEIRQMVYKYLKPNDLVLLVSKLNKEERSTLRETRDETGYALNSSINKKKTMFNTFDSSMQTLQSQQWYAKANPCLKNDIVNLTLPKVPLSRYCQNRFVTGEIANVSEVSLLATLITNPCIPSLSLLPAG